MCADSELFLHLCDLYPKTSEALRKLALERRELTIHFLNQVNNSVIPRNSEKSDPLSGFESYVCVESFNIINQERSISDSINHPVKSNDTEHLGLLKHLTLPEVIDLDKDQGMITINQAQKMATTQNAPTNDKAENLIAKHLKELPTFLPEEDYHMNKQE